MEAASPIAAAAPRRRVDVESERWDARIAAIAAAAQGPVLQIGSRAGILDIEGQWRRRFAHLPFVGLDMAEGVNVDVVGDITQPAAQLRRRLPHAQFGFIVCSHVLEHVRQPWRAAETITHLLRPSGGAFVAVPWVQGYHPFPDDFWRFSATGLAALFPGLTVEDAFYSGSRHDRIHRLRVDGALSIAPDAFIAETELFQITLAAPSDERIRPDQPATKLPLSPTYMPTCLVNVLFRKPA
ncbi:MAG: methyltransferase domain-containing protein [Alphaproteobacteria bacterium]|nr:methyltransferase domain-containing protein [Alphaproteobacteria bacterium]